jgi:2-oxoisovalerate dehydrogenase E2 component (dihydrolipoyl transacylase)
VLLAEPAGQKNKGGQLEQAEEITKDEIQQSAGPHVPQTLEEIDGELRAPSSPPPNALAQPAGENAGLITPGVRHMLKELKLDITDIQGTGKDGRVLKEDIQRYTSVMASPSASTAGKYGLRASAEDRLVSLTPSENEMFKVMTRSLDIPHFLYTHTVDLASLNSLRRKFDGNGALSSALSISDDSTSKLTPLPFIMKTLSQAFVQFPRLNSHLDTDTNPIKPQLLIKASHDFGVAIDTPRGLLVPVVRDVQKHSIFSLAAEIKRLSSLAKEGRLAPDDFKGATFTISNIGSIGGNAVSPVIVAPMVGILGIGRVQGVPVFQKDEHGADKIVKREQVVLSWSADHRILDGATVAKCAETLGELLENIDTLGIALK